MINCQMKLFPGKQKVAESSLAAPISLAPLVSEWLCAVRVLALRLALYCLANGDNSHIFCFTVEYYGTEWRHHLPLTNKVVIQP